MARLTADCENGVVFSESVDVDDIWRLPERYKQLHRKETCQK